MHRQIPLNEIQIEATRAGGPGGQSVNTTDSAVRVRWNVNASEVFTEEEKQKIVERLPNRINKNGELYVRIATERSQLQNREEAIEVLERLVNESLTEPEHRETKIPRSIKRKINRKRLEEKGKRAQKKAGRGRIGMDD